MHNLSIDVSAEEDSDNLHAAYMLISTPTSLEILKGLPLCTVLNFNRLVMRLQARVRGAICRKERRMKRNFGKTGQRLVTTLISCIPHDFALVPAAASHARLLAPELEQRCSRSWRWT
jgi:hypothetical protein